MKCILCEHELSLTLPVGRRDECPYCHVDLHACRQCRFFDPAVHNQCREPQTELVVDKEKANFCDYFEFGGKMSVVSSSPTTKKKLEDLFRK